MCGAVTSFLCATASAAFRLLWVALLALVPGGVAAAPMATSLGADATSTYGYDLRSEQPEWSSSNVPDVAGLATPSRQVRRAGSLPEQQLRFAAEAGAPASSFVGRKGTTKTFDDGSSATYGGEIGVARGTNAAGEVGGRQYSGHAFDQMQGRGITPSVVDDAIGSGTAVRGADGSSIFYSGTNNISVVVNRDGRVITVGYGQFKPR